MRSNQPLTKAGADQTPIVSKPAERRTPTTQQTADIDTDGVTPTCNRSLMHS